MITIDTISGLATAPASITPQAFEAELSRQGFTSGLDTQALSEPMSHYLTGAISIRPYSKYGDLSELLAAITLTLPSGEKARTILTPRSAAGPNLRLLVQGLPRLAKGLDTFTWRVFELPSRGESRVFELLDEAAFVAALRKEVQAKCRPNLLRIYNARQCSDVLGTNGRALAVLRFEGSAKDVALRLERFSRCKAATPLDKAPALLTNRDFAPLQLAPTAFACGVTVSWKTLESLLPELSAQGGGLLHVTLAGAWHHAAYVSISIPETSQMQLEATLGALKALLAQHDAQIADWPATGFGEKPKPAGAWPTL